MKEINLYGIEKNFLTAVNDDFYISTEINDEIECPVLKNDISDDICGLF